MPFDGNNNDSTIVAYQQPSKLSTGVVAAQRVAAVAWSAIGVVPRLQGVKRQRRRLMLMTDD
jgi:hypothetical protein